MTKEVFKLAHNNAFYMKYLAKSFYIRRLANYLRQYVSFCPECKVNQTAQHALYGNMIAITSPPLSFHTICIDFILALSLSSPGHLTSILTVIDKFSKKKLLIPGQKDISSAEWAKQLLHYLRLGNWGIPKVTINDQDAKFRLELWKKLFKLLKVDLLVNMAYHLQINGLSKRTNQRVKIALRYLITANLSML